MTCLRHSLDSTQPSRLEPLYVPHSIDFVLPLKNDQKYTRLGSKSFWVPHYRSNLEEEYEWPEEKAVLDRAELVPLRKDYFVCFGKAETSHDTADPTTHLEITDSCEKDLQRFLSVLTGWDLLVVFSATDARPERRGPSINRRPKPADVLCFRKEQEEQETRIAIRRKDAEEEYTIHWTTATLVEAHVKTEHEKLNLKLKSRQEGPKLALASVTAVEGTVENDIDKTEMWVVSVASGSGEIRSIINVSAPFGHDPNSRSRIHPTSTDRVSAVAKEAEIG